MLTSFPPNIEESKNRLEQAWSDYVSEFLTFGYRVGTDLHGNIGGALRAYRLIESLKPNSLIRSIQHNVDHTVIMRNFISKKCEEDDRFLIDLLDLLGQEEAENTGRLLFSEYLSVGGIALCGGMFSNNSLIRILNDAPLRDKLFALASRDPQAGAIMGHKLMHMFRKQALLKRDEEGNVAVSNALLKQLMPSLMDNLEYWQRQLTGVDVGEVQQWASLSLEEQEESRKIDSKKDWSANNPFIVYLGYYLANILELYQNSCQAGDSQLFINKGDINSIRTMLGHILGIASLYNEVNPRKGEIRYVVLARSIKGILEQTKDIQWPENAPQGYDPSDIKWPSSIKDPGKKDEPIKPVVNNQGHSKLPKMILALSVVLITAYLLFGRRSKQLHLAQGAVFSGVQWVPNSKWDT